MGITKFVENDNAVSSVIRASTNGGVKAITSIFASCIAVNVQGANRLSLHCYWTKGNASGLCIRFKETRFFNQSSTYMQELEQTQSGNGTTSYKFNDRYVRTTTTAQTGFKVTKELDNTVKWIIPYVKGYTNCTGAALKVIAVKSYV